MNRTPFQQLSNEVQIAIDTGNRDELDRLDYEVQQALADGVINLPQAAELTQDLLVGTDMMQRDGLTDEQVSLLPQEFLYASQD